jgi:endonuclease/exonuclease/phosphatase (EEP) superfamily protein YafD
MVNIVFNCLISILSVLAFIPLLKSEHWIIRIWDYPRRQILASLIFLLAFGLAFQLINSKIDPVSLLYPLAPIAFLIYKIYPYTFLKVKQLKTAKSAKNSLSIMITNVEMQNKEYKQVVDQVNLNQADILMLLETDDAWRLGIESIEKDYPFTYLLPKPNTYGMLVYSKVEMENPRFEYLINEEIPSFHCHIYLGNNKVRFYGLHPEPPFPTQSKTTVERDAEILTVAKMIAENDEAAIVAGDLNDVAWSFSTILFQKISRMLDPRIGRGFFSTFHARKFWARWPLDHIFVSNHFELVKIARLPYVGSDHFPILIEITLNNEHNNEKPDQADNEDKNETSEKIKKPRNEE